MKNKIELNEVLPLDTLVSLGKKEGLKYFKKINKEYCVQDLCKHWKVSSATFYSKYAPQIGHKPKSRCKTKVDFNAKKLNKNLENKEDLNIITNTEILENIKLIPQEELQDGIIKSSDYIEQNINEVYSPINITKINNDQNQDDIKMEQVFRICNCTDLSKMQEVFNMINALTNQQSIYDIELRMVEK